MGETTEETPRPRIGVSSCLLGAEVRYNGGHSRCRFLTDELGSYVDWVPYCPKVEIGLGTPRETLRLTADGRLVSRSGTADHTAAMAALPMPESGLDGYVFKAKSPSCGIHGIPRYAPSGQPADHRGRGVFAQRVLARFALLPAEDEGRLYDPVLREEFAERIFAASRLRDLLSNGWQPRDLVSFHARHKLQLLAHDPARYRAAGRVVAGAGRVPRNGPKPPTVTCSRRRWRPGPPGAATRTRCSTRSAGSAGSWGVRAAMTCSPGSRRTGAAKTR